MIKRVIVGVDFSDASQEALKRASQWAAFSGVPLVAIHVLQPPAPMLPEAQLALPDPAWLNAMEQHAVEHLSHWCAAYENVETRVCWGSPAEELVAAADAESLLVVSQVGHSRLERLLFGSTAARVVRYAVCDVLVVRLGG